MSTAYRITCPVCDRGSANIADVEDGYCGHCHAQTSVPVRLTVGTHSGIVGHIARDSPVPLGTRLHELLRTVGAEFEANGLPWPSTVSADPPADI